jgi:hypothetical protein
LKGEVLLRDRQATAAQALEALDGAIEIARADLAALERARDTIARRAQCGDDRCDAEQPDSPCDGELYDRFCALCGFVVQRCEAHGALPAAATVLRHHRAREHPGDARASSSKDTSGVSAGSKAVPVGVVQTSSAARRGRGEEEARTASERVEPTTTNRRTTGGAVVVRRKRIGAGDD